MSVRFTTDPTTTLNLHKRHIGSAAPMALVSSGLAFLAFMDIQQREMMLEMLRRSDNPGQDAARDSTRMDYILERTRIDGYSFGLDHGSERSIAIPILTNGRVRATLLMVFMARALSNTAVVEKFLPRLLELRSTIEAECQ